MLYLVVFNDVSNQYKGYPVDDSIDIETVCNLFNIPFPQMKSKQDNANFLSKEIQALDVLVKVVDIPSCISPTEQLKYAILKAKDFQSLSKRSE